MGRASCGAKFGCYTTSPCTWLTTGALCRCKPPSACSPFGGQRSAFCMTALLGTFGGRCPVMLAKMWEFVPDATAALGIPVFWGLNLTLSASGLSDHLLSKVLDCLSLQEADPKSEMMSTMCGCRQQRRF